MLCRAALRARKTAAPRRKTRFSSGKRASRRGAAVFQTRSAARRGTAQRPLWPARFGLLVLACFSTCLLRLACLGLLASACLLRPALLRLVCPSACLLRLAYPALLTSACLLWLAYFGLPASTCLLRLAHLGLLTLACLGWLAYFSLLASACLCWLACFGSPAEKSTRGALLCNLQRKKKARGISKPSKEQSKHKKG